MHDPSPIRPDALLAEADWLHRLARAMLRDDDLAHDVAQETLVVALGAPRTPVTNLRGWLQSIAQRLAARRRRTESRRAHHERQVARPDGDEREAETAERLRLHRRLCEAVLELPEPYRTAVSLRFFDDLPPRAIERQTGASAGVVRQRVHRGLAMLRERFDREAGDRGAWTKAFAAAGFGAGTSSLPAILPLLIMKKVLVSAAVLLVVGAWWWGTSAGWWQTQVPPTDGASAVAANTTTNASRGAAVAEPASVRTLVADVFTVRAFDAQDRACCGASVHRWRTDGEVEVVRTNENGIAEFAPRPEAGGVLVQGRGLQTVVQTVPSLRGEVVVRLGVGRVVAGRVFEDGAPAPAGLQLKLSVPPRRDDLPDAPDAILDLLTSPTGGLTAVTDGSGDFAFAGLADNWAGELQLPRTHWLLRQSGQLVEDNSRLLVLAPDSTLRVETTRLPTVHGRVEWSDGSGPVPHAFVSSTRVTFADGATSQFLGSADEQGRFSFGLVPSAPDQRERWLDPRRRSEPTRIEIGASRGPSVTRVLEAGGGPLDLRVEVVLRLDRPVAERFRAVDEAGNPLAGARALQSDGTLSEPTGEDGLGTFVHPFGHWIGAPGCQLVGSMSSLGSNERSEPYDVVLVVGNSLRVRVSTASGGRAAAHAVALVARRVIYERNAFNLRTWLGESPYEWVNNEGGFRLDRRGEARVVSLTPEVPCRLVVVDHFGGELAAQEIVTPALGEHRVIDITLTTTKYSVRGRVLDASGAPVALASVQLRTPGPDNGVPRGRTERTTADGFFRFAPMHATGNLVLTAHRQGFAATERVVTPGELEHELTIALSPARRTTVRIVDEDGAPVTEARLVVDTATSRRVDQQQIGPGEYTCLDLPPGEVTFACWIAGKRCELRHDTAKPSAELRVPRTARARFERPAGWRPSASGRRFIAFAHRLDATAEPLSMELDDDARGVPQLLLPGRYRIELAESWWNYELKRSDVEPLGPAAEVELRAGEVARVTFR